MLRANNKAQTKKQPKQPKLQTKIAKRKLTTSATKKRQPTRNTRQQFFSTDATTTTTATATTTEQDSTIDLESLLLEAPVLFTQRDLTGAAYQGDIVKLKDCFAQADPKLDVNWKNSYKQTPLILAIKQRHVKSMQFLIKHGADINLPDGQQKYPPIFHAIRKNSVSLFRTLMQSKPNIHYAAPGNKTAMTIAAEGNAQITILNDLLQLGFSVHHRDMSGKTPLMYAVQTGRFKEVEWFLNEGASPTTVDKSGKNAIHYSKTNQDGAVHRLVVTRAQEMNRIHKLEVRDENLAVETVMKRMNEIKAQAKPQPKADLTLKVILPLAVTSKAIKSLWMLAMT